MKAVTKIATLSVAAALGVFSIAGCGSDEPTDPKASEMNAYEDTQTSTIEGLDTIVGDWSDSTDISAVYELAISQDGEFDLNVLDYSGSSDSATQVQDPVTGSVDYDTTTDGNYVFVLTQTNIISGETEPYAKMTVPAENEQENTGKRQATLTIDSDGTTVTLDHEAYSAR